MIKYNIKKIDNLTNAPYDSYKIELPKNAIYYYESLNNQFVNTVEVILKNIGTIKEYEPNKIYIYFDNISDINIISEFLEVLNIEFNNLKFNFIINNEEERKIASKISKRLNLNFCFIESNNYHNKKATSNTINNDQYKDYDINDNIYIKKKDENANEVTEEEQKEYANYNGYNERLIDENVKNIVFRKNNNSNKD